MKAPSAWCARLAAVDDNALGAALRDLAASWRPRCPGLVEIVHARVSEPGEVSQVWWLHLGLVFEVLPGEAPVDTLLGRAVQLLVERHAHVWGVLHHYEAGAPALTRYHRAPEGHPVPELPPLQTFPWWEAHKVAEAQAEKRKAAPEKTTAVKAAPTAPAQRGLFG